MNTPTATVPPVTWAIETIETASLGDRSYVVHDGRSAAVVDPQRDLDRVLAVLEEHDLELVAVLETHVHNDYVSGGLELSRRAGAAYHVAAAEDVAYERVPTADGDEVAVGGLVLRAVHTPGHTPTHLSYVVVAGGEDVAVCTGGGLLFGSVGRTDLISPAMTEELTRAQHRSAHALVDALDDAVEVLPTHGFGSFCSSGDVSGATSSTIGRERETNDALRFTDEDAFVAHLVAGLDAFPTYYARMGPMNRRGPAPVDLSPVEQVDPTEVARAIHRGAWVVDLRDRRAFAAHHLPGTVSLELADSASTYLGWVMPLDAEVVLLGEDAEQVAAMQRQLVRIGVDRPSGAADTGPVLDGADGSYPAVGFAELAAAHAAGEVDAVLDTRRRLEWEEGHLEGAVHVPLQQLLASLDDLPEGRLWVHCASGYRASFGASLLARAGRDVVLVDDDLAVARDVGLPWVG